MLRRRHGRAGGLVVLWAALLLVLGACAPGAAPEGTQPTETTAPPAETTPAEPTETTAPAGEGAALTIAANAVRGGKNDQEAVWIEDYVIPTFEQMMADQGQQVTVEFTGRGVDDEAYKAQLALDLSTGGGADVIAIDGIWVGEFAQAGYIAPLEEVAGSVVNEWDGWEQIPEAVQGNMSFEGQRYGVPAGTDGRVFYFNKDLLAQAGLPEDWQPATWEEILEGARTLQQALPEVTPLQVNAGVSMGEATTMQGFLPLLAGTGSLIYDEEAGQWLGNTEEIRSVLEFYSQVYTADPVLGEPDLQVRQDGRDRSFQEFAAGNIAILGEGDYFWRSVVNPDGGIAPMENRDEVVGWAMIPAQEPGAGIRGQDYVSMSGGGGRVLNPNSANPELAWELLAFMNSKEAVLEFVADQPRITQRTDVNEETLAGDPMLSFVAAEVLPITAYRPGFAEYPQVSVALQEATEAVVTGTAPDQAAADYQRKLEGIVGADAIRSD